MNNVRYADVTARLTLLPVWVSQFGNVVAVGTTQLPKPHVM